MVDKRKLVVNLKRKKEKEKRSNKGEFKTLLEYCI